jgi:hypothetical protein
MYGENFGELKIKFDNGLTFYQLFVMDEPVVRVILGFKVNKKKKIFEKRFETVQELECRFSSMNTLSNQPNPTLAATSTNTPTQPTQPTKPTQPTLLTHPMLDSGTLAVPIP